MCDWTLFPFARKILVHFVRYVRPINKWTAKGLIIVPNASISPSLTNLRGYATASFMWHITIIANLLQCNAIAKDSGYLRGRAREQSERWKGAVGRGSQLRFYIKAFGGVSTLGFVNTIYCRFRVKFLRCMASSSSIHLLGRSFEQSDRRSLRPTGPSFARPRLQPSPPPQHPAPVSTLLTAT